jgi:hypothetical protein
MTHPGTDAKRLRAVIGIFLFTLIKSAQKSPVAQRESRAAPSNFKAAKPLADAVKRIPAGAGYKILAVWHRPCSNSPTVAQLMPSCRLNRTNKIKYTNTRTWLNTN